MDTRGAESSRADYGDEIAGVGVPRSSAGGNRVAGVRVTSDESASKHLSCSGVIPSGPEIQGLEEDCLAY